MFAFLHCASWLISHTYSCSKFKEWNTAKHLRWKFRFERVGKYLALKDLHDPKDLSLISEGTSQTSKQSAWGISSDRLCNPRKSNRIEQCSHQSIRSYPTMTMQNILSRRLLPCKSRVLKIHRRDESINSFLWTTFVGRRSETYLMALFTLRRCLL